MANMTEIADSLNKIERTMRLAIKHFGPVNAKMKKFTKEFDKVKDTNEKIENKMKGNNWFLRMNKWLEKTLKSEKTLTKLIKRVFWVFGQFRLIQGISVFLMTIGNAIEFIREGLDNLIPDKVMNKLKKFGGFLKKTLGPKAVADMAGAMKNKMQYAQGSKHEGTLSRKERMGMIVGKFKDKAAERQEKISLLFEGMAS